MKPRPLHPRAVDVLGALRFADQHELEAYELAPLVRLPYTQVLEGLRELRRVGVVESRKEARATLWRVRH